MNPPLLILQFKFISQNVNSNWILDYRNSEASMKLEGFCDDQRMHLASNLDFKSLTFSEWGKIAICI